MSTKEFDVVSFDEIEAMKKELANLYKHKGDSENIPLIDAIWGKIQRNLDNLLNQGDWANYLLTLESGVVFFNRENKIKAALPIIYHLYIYHILLVLLMVLSMKNMMFYQNK